MAIPLVSREMGKKDIRRPYSTGMYASPPAPPASATGKIGPVSTDRTVASVTAPQAQTGAGDNRTQIYTYLTKLPENGQAAVLYNGDRLWAKITLTLQTAGPVSVGQQQGIVPVLGGQGALLTTGQPYEVVIAKGSRLYVAANGLNRIAVKVEPLPWLEQITALIGRVADGIMARFK